MPNAFANLGKYYQTPYCKNDTLNQQCIFLHMFKMEMKGISNCKKSCSVKEFTGETYLRYNQKPQSNETGEYYFKYVYSYLIFIILFSRVIITTLNNKTSKGQDLLYLIPRRQFLSVSLPQDALQESKAIYLPMVIIITSPFFVFPSLITAGWDHF